MGNKVLILGGVRSGKSRLAVELAGKKGKSVLFVATGEAGDAEMAGRIRAHRRSRPAHWRTLESPLHVGRSLSRAIGDADVVIVDCITLLVSNIIHDGAGAAGDVAMRANERKVTGEINSLIKCMNASRADFIVVSNEVGLGIMPDNALARYYGDLLGKANRLLAEASDEVYLMVAGLRLPLKIKAAGKGGTGR